MQRELRTIPVGQTAPSFGRHPPGRNPTPIPFILAGWPLEIGPARNSWHTVLELLMAAFFCLYLNVYKCGNPTDERNVARMTRLLVVGAGATIEEAIRCNAPPELRPPTIDNFAEKMGVGRFYNYWMEDYLRENGIEPAADPMALFVALTKNSVGRSSSTPPINVERLFEYCWLHKDEEFVDDWGNLIRHGILNPLSFILSQIFYVNGEGIKQLEAGQLVAGKLAPGDVVLNLNYDTIFEMAVTQAGRKLTFTPNKMTGDSILIGVNVSFRPAWVTAISNMVS